MKSGYKERHQNLSTPQEIAWAAGLFEGEGCIYIGKKRLICLISTDEDVVRRFHTIVGCGSVYLRDRTEERYKDAWRWQTGTLKEIKEVLNLFLPYFGERRKAKALELLDIQLLYNKTTICRRGHRKTLQRKGATGIRLRCKICDNAASRRSYWKRKELHGS